MFSNDILTDFKIGPLRDKFNKSRNEMRDFKGMRLQNLSLEYGLTDEQIQKMDKHLQRRVSAQMGVIDYFIGILCQEMDQQASGNYLPGAYKTLSYEHKI